MELEGRRILVVDDDPGMRALFETILNGVGAKCVSVGSAEEGVEIARSKEFDLAILDLRLPGMSGAEAAWKFREHHSSTAVLAVSAFLDQWDAEDLHDLGVHQVLRKPFSPSDLRSASLRAIKELDTAGSVPDLAE